MTGLGKFIGGIKFGVSMDTRKLGKDVKKARGMIQSFASINKKVLQSTAVLAGGAATGFSLMVKSQFQAIDSLAKVSDKLGISTEALAGMRHAAEQTGVGINTMDTALQRMIRRTSEAARGTGEARAAIRELGLDAKALAALSPDQQFSEIARAMTKVRGQSDKVRLAFKLFDSEGVALVNTLKLGKTGLQQMNEDARRLGLTLSRSGAAKIEAANDAIGKMNKAVIGMSRSFAVQVAPAITKAAEAVERFIVGHKTARNLFSRPVDLSQSIYAGILDTQHNIKLGFLGVNAVMTKTVSLAAKAFDFLAKQIAKFVGMFKDIPGVGGTAAKLSEMLEAGPLNKFSNGLESQATKVGKEFWKRFMAETPSEKIARQAASFASKNVVAKKQTTAADQVRRLLGNNLRSFQQVGQGIANLPLVKALPSMLGNAISQAQANSRLGVAGAFSGIGYQGPQSLAALQRGTSAAFGAARKNLNRARMQKLGEGQLQTQKMMLAKLDSIDANLPMREVGLA